MNDGSRIENLDFKLSFAKIQQMSEIDGISRFLPICSSHFAQLSPQLEALNIFSGTWLIRINVFTPPDKRSGGIGPSTGDCIKLGPTTSDLSTSRIISFVRASISHSGWYVFLK